MKHTKFRDSEAKNRLWLKLADELNIEGLYFQLYHRKIMLHFCIHYILILYYISFVHLSLLIVYYVDSVETVKNKWKTMRDYYMRSIEKKTTGSAATLSKRDEALSFLQQTSILKRP